MQLPVDWVEITPYDIHTGTYGKTAHTIVGTSFGGTRWELEPHVPINYTDQTFTHVEVQRTLNGLIIGEGTDTNPGVPTCSTSYCGFKGHSWHAGRCRGDNRVCYCDGSQ